MNSDITTLISEGKTEEAIKLVTSHLETMDESEKGAVLLSFTKLYMEATNEANRQYSKDLAAIISMLKSIDKVEKSLDKAHQ